MQRLETYLFRAILIAALAAIAASPFFALSFILNGLLNRSLDAAHLIALAYLLFIGFGLFAISPVFSENKPSKGVFLPPKHNRVRRT